MPSWSQEARQSHTLSDGWDAVHGVHWSPDGSEVWFTAGRTWGGQVLHAATLDGKVRCLLQTPTNLRLRDVDRDGRVLLEVARGRTRSGDADPTTPTSVRTPGSMARGRAAYSLDGRSLLQTEYALGGGVGGTVWLRRMDGTAPVLLGSGRGLGLSPDGGVMASWAAGGLATTSSSSHRSGRAEGASKGDHRDVLRGVVLPRQLAHRSSSPARRVDRSVSSRRSSMGGSRACAGGFRVAAPGNPVSPDGTRIAAFPDDASQGPVFVSVEDGTVRSIDGARTGGRSPGLDERTGNRSS